MPGIIDSIRIAAADAAGVINWGSTEKPEESAEDFERRMRPWREARFGMFIHWGLYSLAAGKWNGLNIPSYGEWIMCTAHIAVRRYRKLAERFNPVKFDADAWVKAAKNAGMKYLVFTTKHHDGFCLFQTATTDYNIVDGTPFKRDVTAELAGACERHGMRFGIYYSQLDWFRAGAAWPLTWIWNFDEYFEYMKEHLRELLTNYGPVFTLFFDGDWMPQWTPARGSEIEALCRSLQPDVVINNRVGRRNAFAHWPWAQGIAPRITAGDYDTPEQFIPTERPPRDWESNITMNDTFAWKENDHNWKSSKELIRMLTEITGKGGNFLLNVGPTGEGEIPAPSLERMSEIGKWMKANGDAI